MEEKLNRLFEESISELNSIGIIPNNPELIGHIDIKISTRASKRYGCCKQIGTDHHIEISKWLMDLNDDIIKNTIIHELIHCMPGCNNHGEGFKTYAKFINDKLGYNVSRVGNKEEDYKKSNIDYTENNSYKYKIVCSKCGHIYYRKRLIKNFTKKYYCGICKGKLQII